MWPGPVKPRLGAPAWSRVVTSEEKPELRERSREEHTFAKAVPGTTSTTTSHHMVALTKLAVQNCQSERLHALTSLSSPRARSGDLGSRELPAIDFFGQHRTLPVPMGSMGGAWTSAAGRLEGGDPRQRPIRSGSSPATIEGWMASAPTRRDPR